MRGKRVVVTRAKEDAREMIERLEALGAEPIMFPTIEIVPVPDRTELDRALDRIATYDLLILGSKHAAEILFDRAGERGTTIAIPIACVGAKTRAYVEARCAGDPKRLVPRTVFAPDVFRAEALVEEISEHVSRSGDQMPLSLSGLRMLFPRALEGRETLIEELSAKGAIVDAIVVYAIAPAPKASAEDLAILESADAFMFLSGETLRAFFEVVSEAKARALLDARIVGVIGPVAAKKAESLGVRIDVIPETATVEALIAALSSKLQ